ncbi:hypothetical protein ATY78_04855 [Rhizobium sp. R635]|nr:hypothetical protein ATY78_04855 [Rhizobium sp. R635]
MAASTPVSVKQQGGFDLIAFAAIVITILFWASSFVVIRICLGPLTPIELATARYVAAGVLGRIDIHLSQIIAATRYTQPLK